MIRELQWDSILFGKKMGQLIPSERNPDIGKDLRQARLDGYKYVICKIDYQDDILIRLLESEGFQLSDIGLFFITKIYSFHQTESFLERSGSLKIATATDIPALKRTSRNLFPESRFYHDPFFSKDDANRLYEAWIANSVKGEAADVVYFFPEGAFITCRKSDAHTGEIVLLGVKKKLRGMGLGRTLVEKSIEWCAGHGATEITVRTQLRNINAMNFYMRLGFQVKGCDMVFRKIL